MKTLVNNLVAFFSLFALCLMVTGCDTESADSNQVTISPESVSIAAGDSITFTASGGFEYRWSIDTDETWATLSTREGPSTVYTSLRNSDSDTVPNVRTLTVTSYITGSGSPSNTTSQSYSETHTAEAYISHIVDPDAADAPLRISSSAATVSPTDNYEFRASGGTGSYTWSLSTTSYGDLSSSSRDKVVYSANGTSISTTVVLTVSSGSENEVAIITHTL